MLDICYSIRLALFTLAAVSCYYTVPDGGGGKLRINHDFSLPRLHSGPHPP